MKDKEKTRTASNDQPKKKQGRSWFLVLLILFAIAILFAPWLIAKTDLRDSVLNSIVDSPQWRVQSKAAQFGWLSPVAIDNLKITNADQSTTIELERLSCEKTLLDLWRDAPDLGAFRIDGLLIDALVNENDASESDEPESSEPDPETPQFTARINQAHIRVRSQHNDEPVIDVQGLDLDVDFGRDQKSAKFGKQVLFDREPLTPKQCNQGLQLLAPVLADEVDVSGAFSLTMEKLKLPLLTQTEEEFSQRVEVEGELALHEVTAGIRNSVTQRLVKMFAGIK